MSGIFLWAWEGRKRLYQQKGFTKSAVCEQAAREFRREADPAGLFLTDHCNADPQGKVGSEFLYAMYREWSLRNGHPFIDEREFGKVVRRVFTKVEKKRPVEGDERVPTYCGITFDPEVIEDVAV